ncbi:MAG TPA: hypothetical protein VN843_31545 [Anaerolineales bacterium]|nr:hypothetical protein [Anaerolineales bacterium]
MLPFLPDKHNAVDDPWIVFDYEIQMYFETRNLLRHSRTKHPNDVINQITKNATVESMLLHTRIMINILTSKGSENDDITLRGLLPEWYSSENGRTLIGKLKNAYGKRNEKDSPCWVINKMLAHPTRWRTDRFDYSKSMRQIEPLISELLFEMGKITHRPILAYYLTSTKSRE